MTEDEKLQKLSQWYDLQQKIEAFKPTVEAEKELRAELVDAFFPKKLEGTLSYPLSYGWSLKATMKLSRKVDEAALPGVLTQLTEQKVVTDSLIAYKPTLATKAYKELVRINPEAAKVFDQALTITWQSPTLVMTPPPAPKTEGVYPKGQENL